MKFQPSPINGGYPHLPIFLPQNLAIEWLGRVVREVKNQCLSCYKTIQAVVILALQAIVHLFQSLLNYINNKLVSHKMIQIAQKGFESASSKIDHYLNEGASPHWCVFRCQVEGQGNQGKWEKTRAVVLTSTDDIHAVFQTFQEECLKKLSSLNLPQFEVCIEGVIADQGRSSAVGDIIQVENFGITLDQKRSELLNRSESVYCDLKGLEGILNNWINNSGVQPYISLDEVVNTL